MGEIHEEAPPKVSPSTGDFGPLATSGNRNEVLAVSESGNMGNASVAYAWQIIYKGLKNGRVLLSHDLGRLGARPSLALRNGNEVPAEDTVFMGKITREDVRYVAQLAQLRLDEAAVDRLVVEMGDILGYMETLNSLDTEGVEPMMHAMAMTNVFREDVVGASLPRETALGMAPEHDGEYYLVPKILETEGA